MDPVNPKPVNQSLRGPGPKSECNRLAKFKKMGLGFLPNSYQHTISDDILGVSWTQVTAQTDERIL